MQNIGHIKWLKSYLQNENLPVSSYIVFSDRCTLKEINLSSGKHIVVKRSEMLRIVKMIIPLKGVQLSPDQIEDIYAKLYPLTQVGNEVKEAHIQTMHKKKKDIPSIPEKDVSDGVSKIDNQICSRCGAALIMRTASKGAKAGNRFYECSRFPKCRYTEDIGG